MIQECIKTIAEKENLTENKAYDAMNSIMKGECTDAQIGAFLMGLRIKGETIDEITGCAKAMRENATKVTLDSEYAIDTCGTGGDGGKTFNVSTAVGIIAAAGGVKVAKHGNRAVSSKSGSADVLTELGININAEMSKIREAIDEKGMGFLFAQKYHSAMKNVAGPRKQLGTRTVFNLLGPLTNPAFVKGQVLGVYDGKLTHTVAEVLSKMGCERAMVVHGSDGLDEITTTGETIVSELNNGKISDYTISPMQFGIETSNISDISGGDAKENAGIIVRILKGKKGPKRDIVVLNSAAALYVGKVCKSMEDGIKLANNLIDTGKAYAKLKELQE